MIKSEFRQLQRNGVVELCQAAAEQEGVLVQAYNITLGKNDKLSCLISDGRFCIKTFFKEKNVIVPGTNEDIQRNMILQ